MARLPWNKNHIYWLNFRPEMSPSDLTLAMTLTLNFQGQIWNLLYLNQNWSNCLETKSKYINWTSGLKCNQWVWPWPWPWPLNFQGQMWHWPLTTHMTWPWILWSNLKQLCFKMGGPIDIEQRGGSRSFMTMTMTIWWPRIYQIVNGVTSDVSVPSTLIIGKACSSYHAYIHYLHYCHTQIHYIW